MKNSEERKSYLWDWIEHVFKIKIPNESICTNHDSPMDFIANVFFGESSDVVVLANRNGGKTIDFAILDALNSYAEAGCETATLGAIQMQAEKCYRYFSHFITTIKDFADIVQTSLMKRTVFKNGSAVEILTGTVTGVNAPHPQKVFLDEVELMQWFVLQQAFSMATSKGEIAGQNILASTRKTGSGPMQRLLDDAPLRGMKVILWCIWEVVEPLPIKNKPLMSEILDTFPEIRENRELLERLAQKKTGFYKWFDLLSKKRKLDPEIWESEWLCTRPGRKGIVYSNFSETENIITGKYEIDKSQPIYILEDFGFGEDNPDVLLLCQAIWDRKLIVFDELYLTGTIDPEVVNEAIKLFERNGLTKDDLTGWICDPSGISQIAFRQSRDMPIMEKIEPSQLYLVKNGIVAVRRMVGTRDLLIHEKCSMLKGEMLTYARRRMSDGTYLEEAEKRNDHGPDAVRYGVIRLFPLMSAESTGIDEEEEEPYRGGGSIMGNLFNEVF